MSTDVVAAAHRRLADLKTEMLQLEAFIEMSERLAEGRTGPIASNALTLAPKSARRRPAANGSRPREIVEAVHQELSGAGEMLDQHELVERLAARGIAVPGADPAKNLATTLWRNQALFKHVRGVGYRLTDAPLPDAKGQARLREGS